MTPSTPRNSHQRTISSITTPGTPGTPDTGYVLAQESIEESPTKRGAVSGASVTSSRYDSVETPLPSSLALQHPVPSSPSPRPSVETASTPLYSSDIHPSASLSTVSGDDRSPSAESLESELLEMLENDDTDAELEMHEDDLEDALSSSDPGAPLVSRGRRRRRPLWEDNDEDRDRSLFQLIPPLILAHPLPLFPLLALLPYNFLPAGVVLFIPIICVLTVLSSCAHIVIVYLAWYLKVSSFEEVFASVTGKFAQYGQWAGRAAVITSTIGLLVGWLETLHPLLSPMVETYLPYNSFYSSKIVWTLVPALSLLPSLLPSRMTRSLRRAPVGLALLLPIVAFLVIGRTVEIKKATEEGLPPIGEDVADAISDMSKRRFGLGGGSSAGAGLTTLTIFLSPHLNTLPIHSTLSRNKRTSFPLPCLLSSAILLALSLPFALVPYYLLPSPSNNMPTATPTSPSGVFALLPADDGWVNLARILQCVMGLGSCNMWILRGRDSILGGLGVERGERYKIGRWIGVGIWALVVFLACLGGWVAEKVELIGVTATLAVGWLLPSVFFIITFHVRSPLSIVFPSRNPPPLDAAAQSSAPQPRSHSRTDSLTDPSVDVLLARKERQLQKRRLGRRLWQDLIVYVGILPVGVITMAWSTGSFFGFW